VHALYLLTGLTFSDNDETREDGMEDFQVWRDIVDIRIELPFFGTVLKRQIVRGGELYAW